jgi:hypothetical protein
MPEHDERPESFSTAEAEKMFMEHWPELSNRIMQNENRDECFTTG